MSRHLLTKLIYTCPYCRPGKGQVFIDLKAWRSECEQYAALAHQGGARVGFDLDLGLADTSKIVGFGPDGLQRRTCGHMVAFFLGGMCSAGEDFYEDYDLNIQWGHPVLRLYAANDNSVGSLLNEVIAKPDIQMTNSFVKSKGSTKWKQRLASRSVEMELNHTFFMAASPSEFIREMQQRQNGFHKMLRQRIKFGT